MTMSMATRPLGEVVRIVRGISYSSSELSDSAAGVPMVNLRNVGKGGGFRVDGLKYFTGSAKPGHVLKGGDLLLANTDLSKAKDVLGSTFLMPSKVEGAVFSLDLSKLEPDETLLDKRFLNYFLHSPVAREFMKANGQGVTVMHLRMAALPLLEVPVPSLDVQKLIVSNLDERLSFLDTALTDLQHSLVKSRHLRMSVLHKVFSSDPELDSSWLEKSFDDIVVPLVGKSKTQRGWSPQCLSMPVRDETHWGVLKTTAIQAGSFEPEHNKELPSSLEPKAHLAVQPGDLIMTSTGPRNRCGIPCLVEATPPNLIMSGKMFRVRADESRVLSKWLLYFLLSPLGQSRLEALKVGSSDSSVSIGSAQFLRLIVPVPGIDIQSQKVSEIEERFSLADALDKECKRAIEQINVLKRSILYSTFSNSKTLGPNND